MKNLFTSIIGVQRLATQLIKVGLSVYLIGVATGAAAQDGSVVVDSIKANSSYSGLDLCLDVAWGAKYSGANVHLWGCNGSAAQQWKLIKKADELYQVQAYGGSNLCLEVANGSKGNNGNIQVATCNNSPAQQWSLASPNGLTSAGNFEFRNMGSRKCMDVDAQADWGANVKQWRCHGRSDQQFTIPVDLPQNFVKATPPSDTSSTEGETPVMAASLNFWLAEQPIYLSPYKEACLDVAGGRAFNSNNVQAWGCNGSLAQKWLVKNDGHNNFRILAFAGQKINGIQYCLDVAGGGWDWNTNIQIYQCNNSLAQLWLISTTAGHKQLVSTINYGSCLDWNPYGNWVWGANIKTWGCHNGWNQWVHVAW